MTLLSESSNDWLVERRQKKVNLLIAAGKEHWVTKSDELVSANSKGNMQTYWVDPKNSSMGSVTSSVSPPNQYRDGLRIVDDKTQILAS
jgi:hypothetical protein